MAQVAVSQLKFRGDAADAAPAEFRVTDALRTEIADTDRIVIVRQMNLGRMAADWRSRGMADQVGRAWQGIVAGAVHGSESHAASANCVWFADAAEARTALMALLASGRHPVAWYWRHVVPDWAGQPIDQWLSESVSRAIATRDEAACLDIIEQAIAAGAMPAMLRAIAKLAKSTVPAASVPAAKTVANAIRKEMEYSQASKDAETDTLTDDIVLADAAIILSALPALLLKAIRELASLPAAGQIAPQLALILVRRARPDALANPPLLERLVSATQALLLGRSNHIANMEVPRPSHRRPPETTQGTKPTRSDGKPSIERPRSVLSEAQTDRLIRLADAIENEDVPDVADIPRALFQEEMASDAAGLLLLVNALRILGWREWLAEHPQWLLHRPSAALMDKVARHYRVPETDPARQIWTDIQPVPDELDEALMLWRRGLDGWLRRRTGKRLASIVRRRGWIIQESDRISVRFRLKDIDMGMRRHALDRDPGWVDWLGFSLRYHFDDRPIVAGFAS